MQNSIEVKSTKHSEKDELINAALSAVMMLVLSAIAWMFVFAVMEG